MGRQRTVRVAAVGSLVALLLLVSSVAAASTATVRIGETNNRYHFSPVTVFVTVGGKVTWTNGTDAAHGDVGLRERTCLRDDRPRDDVQSHLHRDGYLRVPLLDPHVHGRQGHRPRRRRRAAGN